MQRIAYSAHVVAVAAIEVRVGGPVGVELARRIVVAHRCEAEVAKSFDLYAKTLAC